MTRLLKALALLAALLLPVGMVHAQAPKTPPTAEQRQNELEAAFQAALEVATKGPAEVKLLEQGAFNVPANLIFIPAEPGKRLMRALGNTTSPRFLGLMIDPRRPGDWLATLNFIKEGYVKDEDAKTWNIDELLSNVKAGTEAGNEDRISRGFSPIEIVGWVEKPFYDAATHRFIWSLSARDKGANESAPRSANYNTYLLGREGYFSLNFICDEKKIDSQKTIAQNLLAGLNFAQGKRYEDFNASTDNVAAYGLAALVGGAAAKKLGLLAVVLGFFAKFAKILLVAGGVALYGVKKLFFGAKAQTPPAPPAAPQDPTQNPNGPQPPHGPTP